MANNLAIVVNPRDHKRLISKLEALDKFGDVDLEKIINNTAKSTVDKMERNAPFDTGRLRRNIDFVHLSDGIEIYSEAIDPITKKDYAPDQEYGTRFFRAHPYFFKNIKWFNNRFRQTVANTIQKILLKR